MVKQRAHGRNFIYEFYFKGKRAIDVGCGEGEFLKFDKALIEGVDANKRVIAELTASGFKVKLASGDVLPYKDDEFEMAHCHNVIEHLSIEKARGMIQETARVLRSGGLFVLSSEVVTKKFWNTFGHVKPYPPEAVIRLFRKESREEFDEISNLESVGVFYLGDYHKNRILYFVSALLGYLTPLCRREYFLILRKK